MDPEERPPQAPNRQADMQSRRIDLEREISIRVPAFDSFITEYSANVSTTGMFIRSEKPLPPDTALAFEFKVADDWKLIRGKATVVWSRYRDEGPERPAGMGVLFTELDAQSRRLIGWIIEKHVNDGGTPFDLGELKGEYDERAAEISSGDGAADQAQPVTRVMANQKFSSEAPASATRSRAKSGPAAKPGKAPLWRGPAGLIAAALLVAVLLGGLFWLSEKGAQSAANPELETSESEMGDAAAGSLRDPGAAAGETAAGSEAVRPSASSPPVTAPVSEEPASAAGTAAARATAPEVAEAVGEVLTDWARAWQSQDVEAYLSHYSSRFRPSGGETRSRWAEVRRERLTAPEFIEITVSDLQIEALGDDGARATFIQGYSSNTFEDSVRKVLELEREGDAWRIVDERSAD